MKISKEMFTRWQKYAVLFLADNGATVECVTSPQEAWNIAHKLDIPREAYHTDSGINDSHIATALRKIFPKAW